MKSSVTPCATILSKYSSRVSYSFISISASRHRPTKCDSGTAPKNQLSICTKRDCALVRIV